MNKIFRFIATLMLLTGAVYATTLTGVVKTPGTPSAPFNGSITYTLNRPATCSGTLYLPNPVTYRVVNGQFASAPTLPGNDCLLPKGQTYYTAQYRDQYNLLVAQLYYQISGANFDIGVAVPINRTPQNMNLLDFTGLRSITVGNPTIPATGNITLTNSVGTITITIDGDAGITTSLPNINTAGVAGPKFSLGGTIFTTDQACVAGNYWLAPIAGALNTWRKCTNGVLSDLDTITAPGAVVRQATYIMDNGTGLLLDTDDKTNFSSNQTGAALTITKVICKCDAGAPTVMIRKNGVTNVLGGALACSVAGANTTTFASAAYANNDWLDILTVTAGGVAHNYTVVVVYQ